MLKMRVALSFHALLRDTNVNRKEKIDCVGENFRGVNKTKREKKHELLKGHMVCGKCWVVRFCRVLICVFVFEPPIKTQGRFIDEHYNIYSRSGECTRPLINV